MNSPRLATRSLAEGALLAALAAILAVAGVYLPLLGPLAMLAWPVPVVLAQLRHGMRLSLLTVVVTGLMLASLLGPLLAVGVTLTLGPLGIALGEALRRRLAPWTTLGIGALAALGAQLAGFALALVVMGHNPLAAYRELYAEALQMTAALYRRVGLDAETLVEPFREQIDVMLGVMLPATLVTASVMTCGFNYGVTVAVLRRLGYTVEPFPPFAGWQLPAYTPLLYLAAAALVYLDGGRQTVLYAVGANVSMVVQLVFLIMGMAVAYWWLSRYNLSRVFKVVLLAYVLVLPILQLVAMLLGMLDTFFDYRGLRRGAAGDGGRRPRKKGEAG